MTFRYQTLFLLFALSTPFAWAQGVLPIAEPKESIELYRDSEHWIRERFRWYRDQRLLPGEQIPEGVREAAAAWKQRMSVFTPPVSLSKGSTAGMWTNVGPANIGGRITGIAVHPTNPDLVYFTGADGGVWKSTNGGAVFTPIADQLPTMSMGAIAISPSQPEVLLVGTGEANGSGDSYGGLGAFVSNNAGATWTAAGAKFANNIAELVIHSTTPSIMLAATREGLYRSIDGGGSWNRLRTGLVNDVIQHPTQPSVFFATANGAGVLRSSDHGATWSTISVGVAMDSIGRSAIDICRSQPHVMYCVIVASKGGSGLKALVKSIDGGLTLSLIHI